MIDMPTAARITENCIRLTANLFPAPDFPIDADNTLVSLRIDRTRIPELIANIAGDDRFGIPSLVPRRRIDVRLLDGLRETSTVFDVFNLVRKNTVLA